MKIFNNGAYNVYMTETSDMGDFKAIPKTFVWEEGLFFVHPIIHKMRREITPKGTRIAGIPTPYTVSYDIEGMLIEMGVTLNDDGVFYQRKANRVRARQTGVRPVNSAVMFMPKIPLIGGVYSGIEITAFRGEQINNLWSIQYDYMESNRKFW